MNPSSKIIDLPNRQSPVQRTLWGTVTAAFWVIYAYLLLPLVTLLLWIVGVRNGFTELYVRENGVDPFLLVTLPLIALVCTAVVVAWAEYNRHRFAGKERRQPQPDATRAEIAAAMGASESIAQQLLDTRSTLIQMDAHAQPIGLKRGPVEPIAIS